MNQTQVSDAQQQRLLNIKATERDLEKAFMHLAFAANLFLNAFDNYGAALYAEHGPYSPSASPAMCDTLPMAVTIAQMAGVR